jgi:putative transcriptional regulator
MNLFGVMMNLFTENMNRDRVDVTEILASAMPIKWRLAAVMADREVDNQKLHELTGFHPGTISKLRNNAPARVDLKTLEVLCKALDCQPGELLRYLPDEE